LFLENPITLARKKIVPGDIDEERLGPLCLRKLSIGGWDSIDRSCIDDNIDAAELKSKLTASDGATS
jgi:hypothetical protein